MRVHVNFELSIKGHTLKIAFGADEPPSEGPRYVDTLPTPMEVTAEPIGFRRLDDPLHGPEELRS